MIAWCRAAALGVYILREAIGELPSHPTRFTARFLDSPCRDGKRLRSDLT